MMATEVPAKRARGRPPGGGNSADQSCEALLDAAERSLLERGYRASTMEVIAAEAGYTRTMVYRHFATRDELMDAVLMRRTAQLVARLVKRQAKTTGAGAKIVEAIVEFVTGMAQDPVYMILTDRNDRENIASLPARESLVAAVEALLMGIQHGRGKPFLRKGLRPLDAAHFVITSTLALLSGLIPGSADADQIRRYVRVFVLPALMADAPPVEPVFEIG